MKFKLFAKTVAFMTALFSWGDKVPIVDGKVSIDDDQKQKLQEALGENHDVEEVLKGINKEIADAAKGNADVEAAKNELRAMLDENTNLTDAEKDALMENKNDGTDTTLTEQMKAVKAEMGKQFKAINDQIEKLVNEAEGDHPAAIIDHGMKGQKIQHSATHLFASNKAYDAFEERPWNRKAAGLPASSIDLSDSLQVAKLNGDAELYYREHSDRLTNLNRDQRKLPSFWPVRTKVVDRISDGNIVTAEITQGRKLPWLPKNKQEIQAEEGRIYPVQLDAEFIGFDLQVLLESWLNNYNKEGSQAYKVSFVGYLLSFLDQQARLEDRKSTIGGIFVQTPKNATVGASYMNRQDGVLYQLWKAINVTKKLKVFGLGLPTTANIVDYVDAMIKRLPDEVREQNGLVLYLSDEWIRAYKRRYEQVYGSYTDYKGYPTNPKDYANIKFEPLVDLSGTDVMFITFDNNIEILENVPSEKSMYRFESLLRKMYVFADYKYGVRVIHIGRTVQDGDPEEFKVQTVWSNDAPLFKSDFYVPVYDDTTGKVVAKFNQLKVDAAWATTITEFTDTYEGQVIKLQGNTALAGATTVADGAKINLAGDTAFNLKLGGTLTLVANGDGTVTEIKRTAAPATLPSATVEFTGTTFDANLGTTFILTGGAATLSSITGGVEGKVIKVYGSAANALTFDDTATVNVSADHVADADGDYVELVLIDGVWEEKSKNIAA